MLIQKNARLLQITCKCSGRVPKVSWAWPEELVLAFHRGAPKGGG